MSDEKENTATDSGTATYDTYTVKPSNGKKGKDLRTDDTGQMGNELFKKNPGLYKSPADAQRAIINFNNTLPQALRTKGWRLITDEKGGTDCSGQVVTHDWRIFPGQVVYYPNVPNEITNPREYSSKCPEASEGATGEVSRTSLRSRAVEREVQAPEVAVTPIYQAITNSAGTMVDGSRYDNVDFFVGEPPHDAAANKRGPSDRLRKD
ncbi:MAG: hypothetical protein K2X09_03255, partial [Rickettsiales bacterium]|nr:hypothetical protein [Rickettsiales bacterium]